MPYVYTVKSYRTSCRMVFGQPRQEDLINFINSQVGGDIGVNKIDKILNCRIDLTPK
jgi:hypothetical protein